MRDQQRQEAARHERPIAQLTALLFNINRSENARVMTERDWWIWNEQNKPVDSLSPATVAAMLALRSTRRLPESLLPAWHLVAAQAHDAGMPPDCKALRSDCGRLWIVAPSWEGHNIRGGLVGCHGHPGGMVTVRDIDRQLLSWAVTVPRRQRGGWIEADLLLMAGT